MTVVVVKNKTDFPTAMATQKSRGKAARWESKLNYLVRAKQKY